MDKDIFEEVRRIEQKAEDLLAKAQSDHDDAVKKARAQAVAYLEKSTEELSEQSDRLRGEHERALDQEKASIKAAFAAQKTQLEETAARRTDELAGWVADRFLEQTPPQ